MFISIPTYQNGVWYETDFQTREDYVLFVKSCFKEPGKYEFDKTSFVFNEESRKFNLQGHYCNSPLKSKDFKQYWDDQKNKCRRGAIFHGEGNTWYLPRDYYMWLNFLPIYDKEEKKFGFAKLRDAQYHMALYELLAELHYRHSVILKKRQIASSYFHMAKLLNTYWFEQGAVLKMGASLKDYINEKGSWKFLDEYKNFLNQHTAWYRPAEPEKIGAWTQRIKIRTNGRDTYRGLGSSINSYSFEKDPTNGVGGPVVYFFHEEGGIAPKMDDTYGFLKPAMKSGMITTGMFIAAGSVGDLDQCLPLKDYMLNPDANEFYSVTTDLLDKQGTIGVSGLFIPEQWSMPPYIDEYGNSIIHTPTPQQAVWLLKNWLADGFKREDFDPTMGALKALDVYFEQCKKNLKPDAYQLELSQHPRNIEEAFASRKEPIFPGHLISHQKKRIQDKEFPVEYLDIETDYDGKPKFKATSKLPISEFPISKKTEDKTGIICVWERPMKNAPWGTYYGSVDPVSEGKTTTSESLCSIIIYKNPVEVITDDNQGNVSRHIEGDQIVCSWTGRFDDIKKTHERLEMIIEIYNAWTVVENNVALFIQYMMSRKKQKFLVPKDQIIFLKEVKSNLNVFSEYGWKNTGTLFKTTLLSYGVEFMQEEINQDVDKDGNITKVYYGIERIPDPMILEEAENYQHGLNVDRLIAYCALVAFAKMQLSNLGMKKIVEVKSNTDLINQQKMSKLKMNPYRHMGGNTGSSSAIKRNPFKNLR